MGEPHVISALSNKRAELTGIVSQLERQLGQQRAQSGASGRDDAAVRFGHPAEPDQSQAAAGTQRMVPSR